MLKICRRVKVQQNQSSFYGKLAELEMILMLSNHIWHDFLLISVES